jgi:hypothetical protein
MRFDEHLTWIMGEIKALAALARFAGGQRIRRFVAPHRTVLMPRIDTVTPG